MHTIKKGALAFRRAGLPPFLSPEQLGRKEGKPDGPWALRAARRLINGRRSGERPKPQPQGDTGSQQSKIKTGKLTGYNWIRGQLFGCVSTHMSRCSCPKLVGRPAGQSPALPRGRHRHHRHRRLSPVALARMMFERGRLRGTIPGEQQEARQPEGVGARHSCRPCRPAEEKRRCIKPEAANPVGTTLARCLHGRAALVRDPWWKIPRRSTPD